MKAPYTYRESFTIRSSEVHPSGRAKLQSICDLMQETAGNHALKLDFDISQLLEDNLTWILHRLHIQMDQYPGWRDTVTIKTWPSSGDTIRAYRDFELLDRDSNRIGRALSYWLMLNTETRRPVRMPRQILDMAPRDISHVLNLRKERIPALTDPEVSRTFEVRRSDLDLNQHVNNVKYVEWILETIPDYNDVQELDIEFHAECRYGDTVISDLAKGAEPDTYRHRIRRSSDGNTVALAQSRLTSG